MSYLATWCTQRLPTYGTSQIIRGVANPGRYPRISCCRDWASRKVSRQCSLPGTMSHM